ncbi:DUF2806 domain-containing protein [Microvirga sp. M2]|uniref:DUF2806 domain-containing protein n=1 Tax=Microvirga sp. M2 TaxID=3073270 RepID=UPI0039C40943
MSDQKLPTPSGDHHPFVRGILAVWGEIKDIPGAAKAIAKLVGIGADAGAAHLDRIKAAGEAKATATRDEIKARSAVSEALTQAAVQRALADPELADRALALWADERITKQVNREAVASVAIEDLREDPPPPDQESPSDDWMNVFASYAERASSETLRQHWGRILAGQIRKPGSFSFQTLQLMSILDGKLAEIIQRTVPAVVSNSFIPNGGPFERGNRYGDLLDLNAVGFLQIADSSHQYVLPPDGRILLRFKKFGLGLTGEPGTEAHIPVVFLTRAGRELMDVIHYDDDVELIRQLAVQFQGDLGLFKAESKMHSIHLVEISEGHESEVRGKSVETLWTRPSED